MSLAVFTDKSKIPKDIKFVNYNDIFFGEVLLNETELVKTVLEKVDRAIYHSPTSFIGRDKDLGALHKSYLSTGCKTLLNIISNPNICFDVCECGPNALTLLSYIKNGYVYWHNPALQVLETYECDIKVDNITFTDFEEFVNYIMDGDHDE